MRTARFLPTERFNHMPQGPELGRTPRSAYRFSPNVVLERLRVVNQGSYKPATLVVGS